MAKALSTPALSLLSRIFDLSGENELPLIWVVARNCSIVYCLVTGEGSTTDVGLSGQ
jgi:hypothetical protein